MDSSPAADKQPLVVCSSDWLRFVKAEDEALDDKGKKITKQARGRSITLTVDQWIEGQGVTDFGQSYPADS